MVHLQFLVQKRLHLTSFCVRNHLDLHPLQPYHGADFSFMMSCNIVVFPKFSSLQFSLVSLRIIITFFFFFFCNEKNHLRAKCKYFQSTLTRLLTPLLGSNQASSWLGQFDLLWVFCSLKTHPSPSLLHSLPERWAVTNHRNWATWPQSCTPPLMPLPVHATALRRTSLLHSGLSQHRKQPPSLAAPPSFLSQSISPFSLVVWTSTIQQITDPSRKKAPAHLLS